LLHANRDQDQISKKTAHWPGDRCRPHQNRQSAVNKPVFGHRRAFWRRISGCSGT